MKVQKFVFPTNFTVDVEVDHDVHVILDRPFLATGDALTDVVVGHLILRLNDEYIIFNIYDMMKYPKFTFSFPCS